MLSAKDLLPLSWDALLKMDAFREAIWESLGNKGPYEHSAGLVKGCCPRCGKECSNGMDYVMENWLPCPVPPPIDMEPEVVAERLRKKTDTQFPEQLAAVAVVHAWVLGHDKPYEPGGHWMWYAVRATPIQRIIVCLLALGLIGE